MNLCGLISQIPDKVQFLKNLKKNGKKEEKLNSLINFLEGHVVITEDGSVSI